MGAEPTGPTDGPAGVAGAVSGGRGRSRIWTRSSNSEWVAAAGRCGGDTKAEQATRCLRPSSRGRSELETGLGVAGTWVAFNPTSPEGSAQGPGPSPGAPTLSCPTAQASGEGVGDVKGDREAHG